jgi:hypothetical protein
MVIARRIPSTAGSLRQPGKGTPLLRKRRRFSVLFFAAEVALLAALHTLSSGMVSEERAVQAAERKSQNTRRGSIGSSLSVTGAKRRYRRSSGTRPRQAPARRLDSQETARTPPQ